MTTTLDDITRKELALYRVNRADETLKEAAYNADGKYFNAAVNRLYYACYYAASALMLMNGLEASTHAGIKTMLGLKFIRTGKLDAKYGRIYQQLFENRQSGDYEDFVYCDQCLYDELYPKAIDFVSTLKTLISL
ncbi:MAG: HEPN domain-containing protein [Bacteroides sp.]|nr:HEPN domain-containing protein [Bacteroides sp.]MCM1380163.1 HEPN domain-containing protein [Bacteroides sp.]MCM1446471.1 HEPN domain-containing protein [Prevotella sp.]